MTESWIEKEISRLGEKYGTVPPPWVVFPETHPIQIHWRMGAGESFMMVWWDWWRSCPFDEAQQIDYFRQWPIPPCWLVWVAESIWELPPWEEEEDFDFKPHFERIEGAGLGTQAEFAEDFNHPKWVAGKFG